MATKKPTKKAAVKIPIDDPAMGDPELKPAPGPPVDHWAVREQAVSSQLTAAIQTCSMMVPPGQAQQMVMIRLQEAAFWAGQAFTAIKMQQAQAAAQAASKNN